MAETATGLPAIVPPHIPDRAAFAEIGLPLTGAEVADTLQPLRENATEISNIAQAAYQQGGVELLRLLDAERSRLEAETTWIDGMVAYQQSVVNLEAAQGVSR